MSAAPKYAVIGQPVAHSLSPALFRWLFERLRLPGRYEAREIEPSALPAVVAEVRRGEWSGVSVTLPHKEAVRALLDEEDALAARIGAVNTLVSGANGVKGYNTDAPGLVRALVERGGVSGSEASGRAPSVDTEPSVGTLRLRGAHVLVIGAGGAARAAVFAVLQEGAIRVRITNRTLARAQALADDASEEAGRPIEVVAPEDLRAALADSQFLVQASRVGMGEPHVSALPEGCLHPGLTVLDMVYRPLETALLREAREQGARVVDGLWMLVFQALEQLRLWTGRTVNDEDARALHAHLSGEAT